MLASRTASCGTVASITRIRTNGLELLTLTIPWCRKGDAPSRGSSIADCSNVIDSSPLFVSPYGNLRLQNGSPARDAGNSNAVPAGLTSDLDGRARIVAPHVDIGALEGIAVIAVNKNYGA